MQIKIKTKAAICVIISIVSLLFLVLCGMALTGGEFFAYVGRGVHYVYYFLASRPFDHKTWIALTLAALSIIGFIYWLIIAMKSESLKLYELVAPFNCLILPFMLLAAYRGIYLGVWASNDRLLVILALVALGIYVLSSLGVLIFSFGATMKRRSKERKEAKEPKVEIIEEEPKETVKVIEKVVYVEKEPEVIEEEEEVEEEEEEVEEEVAADGSVVAKKKVIRKPFAEKMAKASGEIKDTYNILKNELLSYGVKSRISHGSDTFRLRKQEYAKITLVGKNLKLYVATNPKKYEGTTIPVRDEGSKKCFAETPTMIKVKSTLSIKRAKIMIADLMTDRGLTQGEVGNVNYARQLKAKKARTAKK